MNIEKQLILEIIREQHEEAIENYLYGREIEIPEDPFLMQEIERAC